MGRSDWRFSFVLASYLATILLCLYILAGMQDRKRAHWAEFKRAHHCVSIVIGRGVRCDDGITYYPE